ncbi:hypothetical protein CT676_27840 [Bradyrhizobium sp. MOS001]|uniref:SMEK domain-containing protein n=1 Tax=Bradyrhizobium sp. MOS001 TaxID=2133948 RepID=UPI001074C353|nr:SMEK domain-containing protein [Bradyrhizobium sp. MOS001]TFW57818.1 hypothetical protein CT676_27840 [Bradyrhizobium sp. MOS001]
MNRKHLLDDIVYYLTHLRTSVELLNSLNLQDINVHAETFFRDFLNVALARSSADKHDIQRLAGSGELIGNFRTVLATVMVAREKFGY